MRRAGAQERLAHHKSVLRTTESVLHTAACGMFTDGAFTSAMDFMDDH